MTNILIYKNKVFLAKRFLLVVFIYRVCLNSFLFINHVVELFLWHVIYS